MENRKQTAAWISYDWANSAFATSVMVAILPTYFSSVAARDLPSHLASSYWGYANFAAMFVIAFAAPLLGAVADQRRSKKAFLTGFALVGIVFTGLLGTVAAGQWVKALLLYVVARVGWASANVFYDSLLPHVSTPRTIDRISTGGYAVGYIGGGLLLALNLAMIQVPAFFGIPDAGAAARLSFVSVALWWFLFGIPIVRVVPEPAGIAMDGEIRARRTFRDAFQRIRTTLRQLKKYREAFRFLVAYWFYNDGISTIMLMAVIFGREIGLEQKHLITAILLVQAVGIPFTFLFGRITRSISTRSAIIAGLAVYTLISIGGYFLQTALHFYLLAGAVGCVQGGTQALSRSLFGRMIPAGKSAEFFGFFDVSTKFSGVLGPLVFGLVAQFTGNSRWAVFSLVFFFIAGILILRRVNEEEGVRAVHPETV